MNLEELENNYFLSDGELNSCQIDFANNISTFQLNLLNKKTLKHASVQLVLEGLQEVYLNDGLIEKFNFSDITLAKKNENYYLSFDPFRNSNIPNGKDNYVFIPTSLEAFEV